MFIDAVVLSANAKGWRVPVRGESSASLQTTCRADWIACVLVTFYNMTLEMSGKIARRGSIGIVACEKKSVQTFADVSVFLYCYLHTHFEHMQICKAAPEPIRGLLPAMHLLKLAAEHAHTKVGIEETVIEPVTSDFFLIRFETSNDVLSVTILFANKNLILKAGTHSLIYNVGVEYSNGLFERSFEVWKLSLWLNDTFTCILQNYLPAPTFRVPLRF